VGHADAHVALGMDDDVGPHPLEHLGLPAVDGLGYDLLAAEFLEYQRGENALLDEVADSHHNGVEVGDPNALQRVGVGGVDLDGMRHLVGDLGE